MKQELQSSILDPLQFDQVFKDGGQQRGRCRCFTQKSQDRDKR